MPHVHPSGFPPRTSGRPQPGEGQALALREATAFFFTVARGPVPRDRCLARDRPSPYVKGDRFSPKKPARYRIAGALGCHTRIRAGFPRDRCMARDRPSPYVKGRRFFSP